MDSVMAAAVAVQPSDGAVASIDVMSPEDVDDFGDIVDCPYGSAHARMFVGDGDESDVDAEFTIEGTGASEADKRFDCVVGLLQDLVLSEDFQRTLATFMEKHARHFEDTEENKLVYTEIFEQYTRMIEGYAEQRLAAEIPGFKMDAWLEELAERQGEVDGDLLDTLVAFADFAAFKAQMLAHRAGGRLLDLSVRGSASKIHRDEDDDGEERPELGDLLRVTPASPPQKAKKRICGAGRGAAPPALSSGGYAGR